MRADLTEEHPTAEALLELLENKPHAIPFLAVFPGDKPNEPRVLSDFNPLNPGGYRSRLDRVLADCPDPPKFQTAQKN